MPKRSPLKCTESALRKLALAYPEAAEDFPWGHRAFKVKKKMFLILSFDNDIFNVTMKLPDSGTQAVQLPFAPIELLEDWMDESYRAIAPKKLVNQLTAKVRD